MFQIIQRKKDDFYHSFVDEGLIKLKKGVKIEDAKFEDIAENKKNLKFNHQQGAEFLPKTYKTVKEQQ